MLLLLLLLLLLLSLLSLLLLLLLPLLLVFVGAHLVNDAVAVMSEDIFVDFVFIVVHVVLVALAVFTFHCSC